MPPCGSGRPAARSAFSNALGRSPAVAITSPVERISGPSTGSAPGKRANGSTAALTETVLRRRLRRQAEVAQPRAGHRRRQAASTRLTPVALVANGTVRDARGLTSSTKTSPSATASWTFISPTTPSAEPSRRTISVTFRYVTGSSDWAGSTQAESPEWTPASSTCCMTAPT